MLDCREISEKVTEGFLLTDDLVHGGISKARGYLDDLDALRIGYLEAIFSKDVITKLADKEYGMSEAIKEKNPDKFRAYAESAQKIVLSEGLMAVARCIMKEA